MTDDDALKMFTQRIEMFSKGFEMITKNLLDQMEKVKANSVQMAENTAFMPQILKSNKEIKKTTDQLALILEGLTNRLDKICQDRNIM
jgi:hypothetical protein